jgi:hypothetical protein
LSADDKIRFGDKSSPVRVTDFDFSAADKAAELAEARERIEELELELRASRRDYQADREHYKEKPDKVLSFFLSALLGDMSSGKLPPVEVVGLRALLILHQLNQLPSVKQTDIAEHVELTDGRVSQLIKKLLRENPLLDAYIRK